MILLLSLLFILNSCLPFTQTAFTVDNKTKKKDKFSEREDTCNRPDRPAPIPVPPHKKEKNDKFRKYFLGYDTYKNKKVDQKSKKKQCEVEPNWFMNTPFFVGSGSP